MNINDADSTCGSCTDARQPEARDRGIPRPGIFHLRELNRIPCMIFIIATKRFDLYIEVLNSNVSHQPFSIIFIDIGLSQRSVQMIIYGCINRNLVVIDSSDVAIVQDGILIY